MLEAWTWRRIRWSLRKIKLPIGKNDLVLDVGSGANPHPRADVLLEKYLDNTHRHGALVADRPTVLADACRMPFRDKSFDFVIAFHVLEHMSDPVAFLTELQRIGKAGYIETPNVLFERLVPYDVHLLEVMESDGVLWINKKKEAKPDRFLNEIELVKRSKSWRKLFYGRPELFHVQFLWKGSILHRILNPEEKCEWFVDPNIAPLRHDNIEGHQSLTSARSFGLSVLRKWYLRTKPRPVSLDEILACPQCHGDLAISAGFYTCDHCKNQYSRVPLPDFNVSLPLK